MFCEVVIAPAFDADALEVLKSKKNRVLLIQKSNVILQNSIRTCLNGYLVQDKDLVTDRKVILKHVPLNIQVKKKFKI